MRGRCWCPTRGRGGSSHEERPSMVLKAKTQSQSWTVLLRSCPFLPSTPELSIIHPGSPLVCTRASRFQGDLWDRVACWGAHFSASLCPHPGNLPSVLTCPLLLHNSHHMYFLHTCLPSRQAPIKAVIMSSPMYTQCMDQHLIHHSA